MAFLALLILILILQRAKLLYKYTNDGTPGNVGLQLDYKLNHPCGSQMHHHRRFLAGGKHSGAFGS